MFDFILVNFIEQMAQVISVLDRQSVVFRILTALPHEVGDLGQCVQELGLVFNFHDCVEKA